METETNKTPGKGNKKERQLISFDWAVKHMLRSKENFEVVEGFLSELLCSEVRITSIIESETNKVGPDDKYNQVDVVVQDAKGEIILIELQFLLEIDYFQRMLYGVSKTIAERMEEGDPYKSVKKIYSVNIVYFDLGQGNGYVYRGRTDFCNLYDTTDILKLSENQQVMFGCAEAGDLFPEYYVLKVSVFADIVRTALDEWIYFFKHDRIQPHFTAKGLRKAQEILAYNRLSPEEKAAYDAEQEVKERSRCKIASAKFEGRMETVKEYSKKLEEERKVREEKEKALEEKEKDLAEERKVREAKEKELAEERKVLAEKDREIEELKRLLKSS
jgi:predicted transposase/invertase (TIGR01784 family)